MKDLVFYAIITICLLNLLRMAFYIVSSDLYTVLRMRDKNNRKRWHLPTVSVVVPAYNEEKTIIRTLMSLKDTNYPVGKLQIIIANDGSTDTTQTVVKEFIHKNHLDNWQLINRPNKGKAGALNYAMRKYASGRLIMCLDSDSAVEKNAIRNAAQYFRDRNMVALSSNVNIIEDGTVLALVQRFEYLVCYQMKKAQAAIGIEYIVGGIGSMFRRSILEMVEFYDSNTMTEDIDLTMKIIGSKNKKQKIGYAHDSIAYTEAAHSLGALVNQRFRWKYGRSQTFLKAKALFFSKNQRYAKRLSWFILPFAIVQDAVFLFEPLIIGYFLYNALRYSDPGVFISALTVLTSYLLINVWSSDHVSIKDRLRLSFYAPPMYLLMYLLSYAEYAALIKALWLLPKLKNSIVTQHTTWRSPERKAVSASA